MSKFLTFRLFLRQNRILILIFLLAIFFRFFRLNDFQYWSIDEEGLYLSARKIFMEHKPILLVPNTNLAISLGPFFAYISAFIFWLFNSNLVLVLATGSLLGVITGILVYITGKTLFDKKTGLIAFFLYSCSFLISLFDRRWWQLSLDSFFIILSIFSIHKIIKKKYSYSILLAISLSFSWHADPSLLVIVVATIISFLIFKLPIIKKEYIFSYIWLFISFMPFLIAEKRHPLSITGPLLLLVKNKLSTETHLFSFSLNKIVLLLQNFNSSLFTSASKNIDSQFYCLNESISWGSPFTIIISSLLIFFPISLFLPKIATNPSKLFKKNLIILYVYLFSFIGGILLFSILTKIDINKHYFLVIWPVYILLISVSLSTLLKKKLSLLVYLFLIIFFLINTYGLIASTMQYPVGKLLKVSRKTVQKLNNKPFALSYEGIKYGFSGSGWDSLFTISGRPPSWSDSSYATKWIYKAYSLYPTPPEDKILLKQKVILLAPDVTKIQYKEKPDFTDEIDGIKIILFNNL